MQEENSVEFEEVGHSGGQVTFMIRTDAQGRRGYQVKNGGARANRMAMFSIYAIPPGIPVAPMELRGMGQPSNPPPIPNCFPVFINSDSEGRFGHQCPTCNGYWRSEGGASICPYCGIRADRHELLTPAQRAYVAQYCAALMSALAADEDGDHIIDMDAVADAVGKESPKPPFYYSEQRQQKPFKCDSCGRFNDILGKFGYCSSCGTRNDLMEFEGVVTSARQRISEGGPYENCIKDLVSELDAFVRRYLKQLLNYVPMRPRRRARLENLGAQHLATLRSELTADFEIDIVEGIDADEIAFAERMFHRRHVYEHLGGEADERYISESGDNSVRPKQALHETKESAHRFANVMRKIARNLHNGFHEILPPEEGPINSHQDYLERLRRSQQPLMKTVGPRSEAV